MSACERLVKKTFKPSKKLDKQTETVLVLKNEFIKNINDEQTCSFLKLMMEIEEMHKLQVKENIDQACNICKMIFKLR